MAIRSISKSEIEEKLIYLSDTGDFYSKLSKRKIGYIGLDGYVNINVNGRELKAHRIAMILSDVNLDGLEVDHSNGNRSDNRLSNLSAVTKSSNAKNKRLRKNNVTGIHGVSWAKELGKWRSRISSLNNRHTSLGCFDSFFDACCARKSAEILNNYHENHGRAVT